MRQKSTLPSPLTISVAETAEHLAKAVGGKASHWTIWLANDRKPDRVNRKLAVQPGPGRPRYARTLVDAYIREMLANNQSRGMVPVGQSVRNFAPHISAVTEHDSDSEPFILLVTTSPIATYKLTPEDARQIARRLTTAADEIERGA